MHEGTLGVSSDGEGMGSIFFIELPYESSTIRERLSPARMRSFRKIIVPPLIHPGTRKLHVLIVDDDAISRKMHRRILAPSCALCSEACNGQEAIDKVRASMAIGNLFDGILMDSSMPVLNGLDASRLIRNMGYTGKIFGITGNAYKVDIEDFLSHGADEVCIKPLSPTRFSEIIESMRSAVTTLPQTFRETSTI
jgi:CheY-like chemotaxis protein